MQQDRGSSNLSGRLSTNPDLIVQSLYLLWLLQDLVAENIQKIANISQRALYACCSLTSGVEPMPEQPVFSFCLHQLLLGPSHLVPHLTICICLALRREWLIIHHLHSALLSQPDQAAVTGAIVILKYTLSKQLLQGLCIARQQRQ